MPLKVQKRSAAQRNNDHLFMRSDGVLDQWIDGSIPLIHYLSAPLLMLIKLVMNSISFQNFFINP